MGEDGEEGAGGRPAGRGDVPGEQTEERCGTGVWCEAWQDPVAGAASSREDTAWFPLSGGEGLAGLGAVGWVLSSKGREEHGEQRPMLARPCWPSCGSSCLAVMCLGYGLGPGLLMALEEDGSGMSVLEGIPLAPPQIGK